MPDITENRKPLTDNLYELIVQHDAWGKIIGDTIVAEPKDRVKTLKQGVVNALFRIEDRHGRTVSQIEPKSVTGWLLQDYISRVDFEDIWQRVLTKISEHDFTWRTDEDCEDRD
jgi:hypothetical protein